METLELLENLRILLCAVPRSRNHRKLLCRALHCGLMPFHLNLNKMSEDTDTKQQEVFEKPCVFGIPHVLNKILCFLLLGSHGFTGQHASFHLSSASRVHQVAACLRSVCKEWQEATDVIVAQDRALVLVGHCLQWYDWYANEDNIETECGVYAITYAPKNGCAASVLTLPSSDKSAATNQREEELSFAHAIPYNLCTKFSERPPQGK